jgi:hypothetical protein
MAEELKDKVKELKKLHRENIKTIFKLEEENKKLKSENYFKISTGDNMGVQEMWFEVKESLVSGQGKGVFTKRPFKNGEIVMRAPIIRFPLTDLTERASLRQYNGNIGDGTAFLTMDYQGLVKNSPDNNNLRATWRIQDGYSEFVATRDIKIGEELYQSYGSPNKVN